MLKPLTMSLSLAMALGFCSVSMAGAFDGGCTTCGLASPQGVVASPQGYAPTVASCDECVPAKKCKLFGHLGGKLDGLHCKVKSLLHPPVTYEWVLKKKRLWGHKGGCGEGCGDSCGPVETVYPTSQVVPSGQGYAAPSGQGYVAPTAQGQAAPTGQVYGAGQHTYLSSPTATVASVPAELTPSLTGEEAPPAPEVRTGGLLLPTPAGE
ncbi:hypothetical protein [Planctomyces sp. SH-PL62]|uniref:hypothetical protein n=1 Tax=Planctomyces sp. SH-PL62 TaxID=1636152 RepID=UPI00078CE2A4|nr:hypothetical protein [Planctomyces sp. SH-PL62]AMV40361.1 hypothetical protein VT85_23215 [Planctomyces sp. SH-PL62]